MKRIFTIAVALFITASVWAQAPEKMSYQAVVRDATNALASSQTVGMQLSILQGSVSGTAVYVETQTPNTNINGLVSIEIGSGIVVSGTFNTIDWSNGPYFIKTETDPTGGTTYTITGTSQLLSVPYALHSNTADSIVGGVSLTETDPIFGASIANGITAVDTANWNSHTVDTDTQLDSIGVSALGFVAGPHTVDTDTQLDSIGISTLGYVAGAHTDSTTIANMGFVSNFGSTSQTLRHDGTGWVANSDLLNTGSLVQVDNVALRLQEGPNYGLEFPANAYGGTGDQASIRYYNEGGENTKLLISNGNDNDDDITLQTQGTPKLVIDQDVRVPNSDLIVNNNLTVNSISGISTSGVEINGALTSGSASMLLRNGDDNLGTFSRTQFRFGFNNTDSYQHYIKTRHNNNDSLNAIDFYVSDGTAAGSFPTNAIQNLSLVSGKVGIGTISPTSKLQVVGLPVFADNTSAIAGGLTVGAFYRTSIGVLMVVF